METLIRQNAGSPSLAPVRWSIRVRGQVQGVGFRPYVYRLAVEMGLDGFVRNDAQGVEVQVQGPPARLSQFLRRLSDEAPPLARVDRLEAGVVPLRPPLGFSIGESGTGPVATGVTPDSAVCDDCLREMLDPGNRRYRYAFINCTHCGPRYTITARLPYDRPQTSMAAFTMCATCASEYHDPEDRRFHAQPNACPECGPRLALKDAEGHVIDGADPLPSALAMLQAGMIVAIKGLGGYHLACDARNPVAVDELRRRKDREEKPFAVMVANCASAAPWAEIGASEAASLDSRERPIVLLRKKPGADEALPGVAPGLSWLGGMLPYTPLHYLLFHEAAGRPAQADWISAPQELALVMTSANPGGEPLVIGDDEALQRLGGIADAFLAHDRAILARCDDSVLRLDPGGGDASASPAPQFMRRARGYTPRAIRLPREGRPVLALGGYLKNTVCVTRGDEAYLSQHVGDLDNRATCLAMEQAVEHLLRVLEVKPALVACDLHPDFFSTRYAADFAARHRIPLIDVQHHHAHIAAVAAEHGIAEPVLGLALDGVGLGSDGGIWGGELLKVDGARFKRLGRLKELKLPGGDRAAREPWRMAASALYALGRADEIEGRFPDRSNRAVRMILDGGVHAGLTSSAGRLFDAAAGLLEVKSLTAFEGQAAMLLEGLAEAHGPVRPMQDGFRIEGDGALNMLPLLGCIADESDAGRGAALFHATLVQALVEWVRGAVEQHGITRVLLGGGCFMNRIVSRGLRERLQAAGIEVFEAAQAPPNDGGLALGQAWVAMQ